MFTRLIKRFISWKNKPWSITIELEDPVWAGSEESKKDLLNEISKQIQIDRNLETRLQRNVV